MDMTGMKLSAGEIISGTLATMAARPIPYLIYALVMTLISTVVEVTFEFQGIALDWIIGLVAGYAFLRYLMGLDQMGGNRKFGSGLLSYFGVTVYSGLTIILGLILLIVPGLILMARWSIATGLVVVEDATAEDSMQRSWDMTRSSQWSILGAFVIVGLVGFTLIVLVGDGVSYLAFEDVAGSSDEQPSFGASLAVNAIAQAMGVFGVAVVIYLTKRLAGAKGELEAIFA